MKSLAITYALAYGGAAASLFNPFVGLCIYICFAILRPEFLWWYSVPPGNYSRIIAIGLIVGWAVNGFGNWRLGPAKPIFWVLVAYGCCIINSAIFASHQDVAWRYVELHAKIHLPILIGMSLIDSFAKLRILAWVVAASLSYIAFEANLDYFSGGFQLRNQGFAGLDNNSICIAMVTGAGLTFFLGMAQQRWWLRWPMFAASGLLAHCPMFGNSRGGMLALCVTGVVSFLLIPKRASNIAIFMLATVVGLQLAGPAVVRRFSTAFEGGEDLDASAAARLEYWGNAWDAMQRYPLTGLGPDHFPIASVEIYGHEEIRETHSLWFSVGSEMGFPGILCLLAFYGITVWSLIKVIRDNSPENKEYADFARMVLAALTGFFVSASFVALDALEPPFHVALLGAGLLRVRASELAQWRDSQYAAWRGSARPDAVQASLAHGLPY